MALTVAFRESQLDVYDSARFIESHNHVALFNRFEQSGTIDLFEAQLPQ